MLKEIFTSVPKYSILHKEKKKKKTKYNTTDQVVDMQAANFVRMKPGPILEEKCIRLSDAAA